MSQQYTIAKYKIGDFVRYLDPDSDEVREGFVTDIYNDPERREWIYHIAKNGRSSCEIFESNIDSFMKSSQMAKADAGKLQLTLVPRQIIKDIAEVRMYGNKKYGDPDNWKTVEESRYRDAAFRHFLAYLEDPDGVDEESGIAHLKHLACNVAFLCEFAKERANNDHRGSKETSGENN